MISNRLKSLRLEKELTQKDLANYLAITASAYGYYEQGKRFPDLDSLKLLSELFNVSIDYLVGVTNIRESAETIIKNQNINSTIKVVSKERELPPAAKAEHEVLMNYLSFKYGLNEDETSQDTTKEKIIKIDNSLYSSDNDYLVACHDDNLTDDEKNLMDKKIAKALNKLK